LATQPDFDRAVQLGQFVQAAYQRQGKATDPDTYAIPKGWTVKMPIFGNDLATDVKNRLGIVVDYVPYGFVAKSDYGSDYIIAIRGTEGIFEWLQDAYFFKKSFPFAPNCGQTRIAS
jgi:hypothetical protein